MEPSNLLLQVQVIYFPGTKLTKLIQDQEQTRPQMLRRFYLDIHMIFLML